MTVTVAIAFLTYGAGLRADRALTKPGEHPPSLTSLGVDLASPGSVSEDVEEVAPRGGVASAAGGTDATRTGFSPSSASVAVRYRGKTAREWAMRFRWRTGQLQDVKRTLSTVTHSGVYGKSADENAFNCIHSHEGRWDDPNPPFYGGLQMDMQFQRTYGDWALAAFGTADHWPVSVQLAVAIRAKYSGRGFYPWPNTARYCGLI